MRPLAPQALLQVWEWGQFRHPIDQAVTLLTAAEPDLSWDAVTRLSIGQRDARLLALRAATSGPDLAGYAECPRCQSRLEFTLDARRLLAAQTQTAAEEEHELALADLALRFRLPNSRDLAALISQPDLESGRSKLISRCVISAVRGGEPVAPDALSEEEIEALGRRITDLDPLAEIRLDLECTECGHRWEVLFDVHTFLWQEVRGQAQRLLEEVHLIAGAYGWTEDTILGLSAARRRHYLGLILQ